MSFSKKLFSGLVSGWRNFTGTYSTGGSSTAVEPSSGDQVTFFTSTGTGSSTYTISPRWVSNNAGYWEADLPPDPIEQAPLPFWPLEDEAEQPAELKGPAITNAVYHLPHVTAFYGNLSEAKG